MVRGIATAVVLFPLFGCGNHTVLLPEVEGAKGVLVVVEGEQRFLVANDLGEAIAVELGETADLLALFLPRAPEDYFIARGRHAPVLEAPNRPLPSAIAAFSLEVRGGEGSAWSETSTTPSEALKTLFLPAPSPEACVLARACFTPISPGACLLPCIVPAPAAAPRFEGWPARPALSRSGACPEGWTERERTLPGQDGLRLTECEAFPGGLPSCASGDMPAARAGACRAIGAACPASGWPSVGSGPALYVRGGAVGGDGSIDRPFGTLGEALGRAVAGDQIVLAAGRYDAPAEIGAGIGLIGACASEVTLAGTTSIRLRAGARLSALRLSESSLVVNEAGAPVSLEDLSLESSRPGANGVEIEGARLAVRRVSIIAEHGFLLRGSAALDADELYFRGTLGLEVRDTATASIAAGVFAVLEGGAGARVQGGSLRAIESRFELVGAVGVDLSSGEVDLEAVAVRSSTAGIANGILVSGGRLHAQRLRIEGGSSGLVMQGPGSLELSDVAILDTSVSGLWMKQGQLRGERLLISGPVMVRGFSADPPLDMPAVVDVALTDLIVVGIRGVAIIAGNEVALDLERARVADIEDVGIEISEAPPPPPRIGASLRDVEVARTARAGLDLQRRGKVQLERVRVTDSGGANLIQGELGSPTQLIARDLELLRAVALEPPCEREGCFGASIALHGGTLDLERFALLDEPAAGAPRAKVGLSIAEGAVVSARQGRIDGVEIGLVHSGPPAQLRDLVEITIGERVSIPCEPCSSGP